MAASEKAEHEAVAGGFFAVRQLQRQPMAGMGIK